MSLTLLVEKNPMIESFYSLNLLTWLGLQSYSCPSAVDAIDALLVDHKNVNLIVSRSHNGKEESAKAIIEFLKDRKLKIPLVVIGPGEEIPGSFAHISNSLQLKPMIKACASALGITAKEMSTKEVPDFFPVPLNFFKELKTAVCSIYSQNPDNPNDFRLAFEENTPINLEVIRKLMNLEIENLFIEKKHRLTFVNNLSAEYLSLIEHSELSQDERITATEKGIELLSKKLLSVGISEETIKLANKNMLSVKNNVKAYPKISKLLDKMLKNKSSYLFMHTQILTFVGLHIMKNIDWGSPAQEESICFIAFFHDIALENDDEAKIASPSDFKKTKMSPKDRTRVEKHAQIAAELVSKFPHAPMGTDQLIRQHHGMLNGVGYTDQYSGNISPAAMVLIVAEEFTKSILAKEGQKTNTKEIIQEVKKKIPAQRFKKIIALLDDILF